MVQYFPYIKLNEHLEIALEVVTFINVHACRYRSVSPFILNISMLIIGSIFIE